MAAITLLLRPRHRGRTAFGAPDPQASRVRLPQPQTRPMTRHGLGELVDWLFCMHGAAVL